MATNNDMIPHLFRTEYRKIVSVLTRYFGLDHIETAEDIAAETFVTAIETWGLKGLPDNPTAWLYTVAKNNARTYLNRHTLFNQKVSPALQQSTPTASKVDIDLSDQNINDSQLQMMFVVCHPSLSTQAQVCLALRVLCGFGIEEIADAFLLGKETINKRLLRAKTKLRSEHITIELPPPTQLNQRLEAVLLTIYLLFNEGYYSASRNQTIRQELCLEAIRLCYMLVDNESTNTPVANALLALMCFHASRLEARVDLQGELITYDEQDTSLWNAELIEKGEYYLARSASGSHISKYHLEAAIAFWHTHKADTPQKWENILQLYNELLTIEYSPMAALNRTFALAKANGKPTAITEALKLKLTNNYLYWVLLGQLHTNIDNHSATLYYQKALALAKTKTDKQAIQRKLDGLGRDDEDYRQGIRHKRTLAPDGVI